MPRQHQYALLAPWYERVRHATDVTHPALRRPAIQKYATSEFVSIVTNDPRQSLQFDKKEDVRTFTVPAGAVACVVDLTDRQKLAGRLLVHSTLRKLYQPNHERFYAVVVELVCDEPGFPLPSETDGLEVGFVVRRLRTTANGSARDVKALARLVTDELAKAQSGADLATEEPRTAFTAAHADAIRKAGLSQAREAWLAAADGSGQWAPVDQQPPGFAFSPPVGTNPAEEELVMWPIRPSAALCELAGRRSLWFGVVPTFSGTMDSGGQPKLDDHATYFMQCFVREVPPPGHDHCPRRTWWSAETVPYCLAAFFDPEGTKNRNVRIKLPDLRALAARAGGPAGEIGGAQFERPPQSTLLFKDTGGIPTEGQVGGDSAETCTYAIELLTIVAMFVFSLFLPIVVIVFQLWWLLALRFCWPPKQTAVDALTAFFKGAPSAPITNDQQNPTTTAAFGDLTFGLQADDGTRIFDSMKEELYVPPPPDPTRTPKEQEDAEKKAQDEALAKAKVKFGELGRVVAETAKVEPKQGAPAPETVPDDPLCQGVRR